MNNKCYIICDNDSTQFVIIGDENDANKKLKELKEQCKKRCIDYYGYERGAIDFNMHYFHLHECPFEAYFPEEENNICSQCGGDKFISVPYGWNQMESVTCPTCDGKGKV